MNLCSVSCNLKYHARCERAAKIFSYATHCCMLYMWQTVWHQQYRGMCTRPFNIMYSWRAAQLAPPPPTPTCHAMQLGLWLHIAWQTLYTRHDGARFNPGHAPAILCPGRFPQIHVPQCQKKFITQQEQLPRHMRKPLPKAPPGWGGAGGGEPSGGMSATAPASAVTGGGGGAAASGAGFDGMSSAQLEAMNAAASSSFNDHALIKCEHWYVAQACEHRHPHSLTPLIHTRSHARTLAVDVHSCPSALASTRRVALQTTHSRRQRSLCCVAWAAGAAWARWAPCHHLGHAWQAALQLGQGRLPACARLLRMKMGSRPARRHLDAAGLALELA